MAYAIRARYRDESMEHDQRQTTLLLLIKLPRIASKDLAVLEEEV